MLKRARREVEIASALKNKNVEGRTISNEQNKSHRPYVWKGKQHKDLSIHNKAKDVTDTGELKGPDSKAERDSGRKDVHRAWASSGRCHCTAGDHGNGGYHPQKTALRERHKAPWATPHKNLVESGLISSSPKSWLLIQCTHSTTQKTSGIGGLSSTVNQQASQPLHLPVKWPLWSLPFIFPTCHWTLGI